MDILEQQLIAKLANIKPPSQQKRALVNELRHLRMDSINFNVNDDAAYLAVYLPIMASISADHPSLSGEVERQVARKKRWQLGRKAKNEQGTP